MLCLTFHIAIIEGSLNTWQGVLSPTRGCYHLGISGLCDMSKSWVPQLCASAQSFMKVEQTATDVDVFVDPQAQHWISVVALVELLSCPELHSILRLVLKAGNYMNAVSHPLFYLFSPLFFRWQSGNRLFIRAQYTRNQAVWVCVIKDVTLSVCGL